MSRNHNCSGQLQPADLWSLVIYERKESIRTGCKLGRGPLSVGGAALLRVQRYDVVDPAKKSCSTPPALTPLPPWDPCQQDDTAAAIVARIDYTDAEALHALFERVDVWHVEPEQQTAVALVSPAQQVWLTAGGFPFSEETELTATLPDPCAFQAQADSRGIPGYACYRSVSETFTDLESLADQYPDLAELSDIGNSWYKIRSWGLAGSDIQVLVLTNRQSTGFEKGELVVMAAQHAANWRPQKLLPVSPTCCSQDTAPTRT